MLALTPVNAPGRPGMSPIGSIAIAAGQAALGQLSRSLGLGVSVEPGLHSTTLTNGTRCADNRAPDQIRGPLV